ncbi:SAM-dependent methyltransferase [Pseudobdellovibrio exovorus]|uniref:Putative methyltransferase n=1 Tax=Pseudobdellovibrio exovorus JSS TaxID=1184267 RepID=M4VCG7_9BACT|nr:SAM-dependent methyltransferase [Pseudobdellovibrio exovorus]AGH96175.1 putative methyltransferase [Pseudobdellovibrio exovorus JSS]
MLTLIATPIGRNDEITLRSLELLKAADVVVCESTKETSKLLKSYEIKAKRYEILDEHSTPEDVKELLALCRDQNVVLVSDCGTPSFCDPGFQLVAACRKEGLKVESSLGASSLMGLLSLSSERIYQFHFRGFIPAETVAREREWQSLKKTKEPIVLMDTPYRLKKMLDECCQHLDDRKILLALNLSQPEECILEGRPTAVRSQLKADKAEFMILVYAKT